MIGLDFGSDSLKVGLVQPGRPIEIVTNFQSKRKTPTCITFYKGERMFGSDSLALMPRKPELSFTKVHRMIGRTASDPLVTELKNQYFPFDIYTYKNETNSGSSQRTDPADGALLVRQVPEGGLKSGQDVSAIPYNSPEEMMAMLMRHVNDMTQEFGGKRVKDIVITVPSFYTQHERAAIQSAAEIADFRVLSLIDENTAAALHYGIDRVYEEPYNVLLYNMGASAVQVSVVKYSSYVVKDAGKNKTIGQFEVLGKGWDSSLGGFNFDVKLAELLAERFNKEWAKKKTFKAGSDLKNHVLPMTKLRIQANKIKEVLSANAEYPVRAEQLHAEVDLSTKVTRTEFEEYCDELFKRLTLPIDAALATAGLTLDQINAVELLGGGVRMPKVKKVLDEYFAAVNHAAVPGSNSTGKIEVGQHLNGDEAMALGAAFRAADLSPSFRVRKVGIIDRSMYGIGVQLNSLPAVVDEKVSGGIFNLLKSTFSKKTEETIQENTKDTELWQKNTVLYSPSSQVPGKTKTVAINHDQDILCSVSYDTSIAGSQTLPPSIESLLAVYNVTGVRDFVKEHESKALGVPKVLLTFSLDASGIVSLTKAEATLDLPKPVVEESKEEGSTEETGVDDAKINDDGEPVGETSENATAAEPESDSSSEKSEETDKEDKKEESTTAKESTLRKESAAKKAAKEKAKKANLKKTKAKGAEDHVLRVPLVITENLHVITPPRMSTFQINASKAKLDALDKADETRRQREAAINELEAFILSIKNKYSDDEREYATISTEEQRNEVLAMGTQLEEWLYEDEAKVADTTVFKGKLKDLKKLANPIFERLAENKDRPQAVSTAMKSLEAVRSKLANWTETRPWVTDEEKEKVIELVNIAEKWLEEKQIAQAALEAHVTPAFHSAEVPKQLKPVATAFDLLLKKKKPEPPKPVKLNVTAGNETDGASSAEGTESVKVDLESEPEASAQGGAENASQTETDAKSETGAETPAEETAQTETPEL